MAYSRAVTDDELLDLFDLSESPIVTVPDLAEHIDMSRDGIRHRLKKLEEQDVVRSKHVGSRAVVWWRADQ